MELLIYGTIFLIGIFFGYLLQRHIFGCVTYFKFVENKNKRPRESDDYYLLVDEGASYLFTESEVVRAIERANKQPEDTEFL